MKKLIFLSLMLALSRSTYAVAYCPQVLNCDGQTCKELPSGFYISAGRPKPNTTYNFNNAADTTRSGLVKDVECGYGDIAISRKFLRADIDYPGNTWTKSNTEGTYLCHYKSNTCPFKD